MSEDPQFRIKDKLYPVPQNERLGEMRLIERVTGMTHRQFRVRAMEQLERLSALAIDDEDKELTVGDLEGALDEVVTVARVAQAIQRANPTWSTTRVAQFVDQLEYGDVLMEAGEEDKQSPPAEGANAPSSPNGINSAPQSKSESDMGSNESTTLPTTGTSTSHTSHEELSGQPA